MAEKFSLVAFLRASPGNHQSLGLKLLSLVEASRAEAGCINYDVHQSNDDPAVWVMYENWRSREDLDLHFETPYLQAFINESKSLLEGDFDMHYLSMKSSPASGR